MAERVRSNQPEVFYKNSVFKNFANTHRKISVLGSFLIKTQAGAGDLIRKIP